ncbi:hypothetical protein Droror1_Dr00017562, partial [Drosera rotundifolia]
MSTSLLLWMNAVSHVFFFQSPDSSLGILFPFFLHLSLEASPIPILRPQFPTVQLRRLSNRSRVRSIQDGDVGCTVVSSRLIIIIGGDPLVGADELRSK